MTRPQHQHEDEDEDYRSNAWFPALPGRHDSAPKKLALDEEAAATAGTDIGVTGRAKPNPRHGRSG
jgi:hypothetical protein